MEVGKKEVSCVSAHISLEVSANMNIYCVALIPFRSHMVSAEFDFTFSNGWTNFADNFSNIPPHTHTKHCVCQNIKHLVP